MLRPVKNRIVGYLAALITEDPNIMSDREHEYSHTNEEVGRYEADEIVLDEQGTMGAVVYEYTFTVEGTRREPEIELSNCSPVSIIGYDHDGNEIDATPEQMENWRKNAMDQFELIWREIEDEECRKARGSLN